MQEYEKKVFRKKIMGPSLSTVYFFLKGNITYVLAYVKDMCIVKSFLCIQLRLVQWRGQYTIILINNKTHLFRCAIITSRPWPFHWIGQRLSTKKSNSFVIVSFKFNNFGIPFTLLLRVKCKCERHGIVKNNSK